MGNFRIDQKIILSDDIDHKIAITNTAAASTAYKTFIVLSLLFHLIMLTAISMMPQFFGGETPRKPSIEAVSVNLNDPLSPSQKKHSMPSGGSPKSKITQEIKPHEKMAFASLPKAVPEKPKKTAKKNPAPSKPEVFVKKPETQSDLYANRSSVPVKNTTEMNFPAASFKNALEEKISDSVSPEQEARASDASVAGGTGSSGRDFRKQSGSGTEKGSLPAELGMGEVEQLPKIIKTTEPVYPRSARRRNIEGKITVKFLVSVTGEVTNPSVVSAEPKGIFEENVLKAVMLWKFKPGMNRGKAAATWMILPIMFTLKG